MKIFIQITRIAENPNIFEKIVDAFSGEEKDFFYYKSNLDSYAFIAYGMEEIPLGKGESAIEKLISIDSTVTSLGDELQQNVLSTIPVVFNAYPFDAMHSKLWAGFNAKLLVPRHMLFSYGQKVYLISLGKDEPSHAPAAEEIDYLKTLCTSREFPESEIRKKSEEEYCQILNQGRTEWINRIIHIKELIAQKAIEKAVLARKIEIVSDHFPLWSKVLSRMDQHVHAHRFIYKRNGAVFFGASPELLFSFRDGKLFSEALAGTIERADSDAEDSQRAIQLEGSKKDSIEQNIVVEHIVAILKKYTDCIQSDKIPRIRKTNKLLHLRTRILAMNILKSKLPEIFDDLFPTPAVCGTPKADAKKIISQLEGYERGLYSGALGWLNADGGVLFFVPLRCGVIQDRNFAIFAGGGIVADSEPEAEYRESSSKARAVIAMVFDED